MKKLISILVIVFLSLSAFAQKSNYKVFPFKSGIIEYQKNGKTKGSSIKYIDEHGYKQADYSESVTKIFGMKTEQKEGTILIGPMVYAIDYKNKTIAKGENPVYELYANSKGNYIELGEQAMENLGFTNTGKTGSVLGRECEIWKGTLGEIWTWKGLALKTTTKILGIKMDETATKITIDTKVPANKFEVPKDMEIKEQQIPKGMEGGLQSLFGGQN
jgi:hypothetical protein